MMNNKEVSTRELITKGYLWVNIPSVAIILVVWFSLSNVFNLNNLISIFIGGATGWVYWEFSIRKWIEWALNNNVDQDRLFKIGKMSLLLWDRRKIDSILNQNK
ncbi:hypothetical protein SAMN04488062_1026 [Flavobacterium omnivorum]|uniref:Uncharacterized protein n=1 Tax=Flavobacterium omnivorum TaxID=178355 RepID=A0A1G7WS14_9FLAO|nr:hypothetical protein [Flavobacterium omnivorum]SDG74729.1 hypothetical protein SAMN04488062_1026 [Flavobacterium omnivorum]